MKKIVKVFGGGLVLVFLIFVADIFWGGISFDKLDISKRIVLRQANKELEKCFLDLPKEEQKVFKYNQTLLCLDPISRQLAQRILSINPSKLGFKGPFFSIDPVEDLVRIESREFDFQGEKIETGINFLPSSVFDDYVRMNEAMRNEIGKELFVSSGYRSPGYQAKLFLYYLGDENQYSLLENAKWIAMPGFSEHNSKNTAIDFINNDGISGQDEGQTAEDFERLPEFSWLKENASRYNFYLTYPADNPFGVSYEPWHWHWEVK